MSLSAAHESKDLRRACESCRLRRARFQYRGVVRADRDHTLCFECYRAERERCRARRLAEQTFPPLRLPFPPMLTPRQLAHRQRMLAFARQKADRATHR